MPKLRPLILLSLLVCVPLHAATAADLATQGRAALFAGQHDRAVELFEKAVKLEPNNAHHHYYLGAALAEVTIRASMFKKPGLASRTKEEFERAVQLDANYLEPRFALIDYYMMAPSFMGGSPEKAREQANEVRKRDPIQGHRAMARVYSRDKKPDLARKEFVDAVRENPTSVKAHYYLGTFLLGEKNFTGGLQEIEAALKLDPNYMPAYFRIGTYAALAEKDYARGEQALKKYLAYKPAENEPQLSSAWYFLGQIYEKQGKKAEARSSYHQAQKLAPGSKDITEALKRVS